MLNKFLFVTLPVVLSAWRLCSDGSCDAGTRQSRIIGGDVTEQNSRPFQVALYSRVGTTGELGSCGGALVHQQWVLTAAHCCFHGGQPVDHVQAILGAHSLYDRYENGRRIVNVVEVRVHPDWDPATFAHDLALLRLANVMQLTDTVNVVRLPYLNISNFNFAGMGATVSGWGIPAPDAKPTLSVFLPVYLVLGPHAGPVRIEDFTHNLKLLRRCVQVSSRFTFTEKLRGVPFVAPTLREKLMTVMTDSFCRTQYLKLLPPNTVCGFYSNTGTCKGDNGGPMTIFYNATYEEEVILIGIASFVDASGCNEERPSVFTRVQRYLQWISENTGIVLL